MKRKIKKSVALILAVTMIGSLFVGCTSGQTQTSNTQATNVCEQFADKVVERTPEEWAAQSTVEEYAPNNEITGDYDESLSAKCENGTFVGKKTDDVIAWKGIPFSKQPVGELRFAEASDPEPSDKVYEAYHFGHSSMQCYEETEKASTYEQGEDCLNLNVWSNTTNTSEKKPVIVYIHGGGFTYGGTADPLYNGYNFSQYNPEVLMVTISYRVGMLGMINLSMFSDADQYETSTNNFLLDQTQALKWIKNNIASFGGDPDNVTIVGESAGGASVLDLSTLPQAQGLFSRVIPMSGSVEFTSNLEDSYKVGEALKEKFGSQSVADLNKIPFEGLREFWETNMSDIYTYSIKDGKLIATDPYTSWENGATKNISFLQGRTANEFRYYQTVGGTNSVELYDALCESMHELIQDEVGEQYKEHEKQYFEILEKLGYKDKDLLRQFANDKYFNSATEYSEYLHAKNGGKGYAYVFEAKYDNPSDIGAGHAVDCYFLFGSFDGNHVLGTVEQQKLSRVFQRIFVNYAISGNPSIDGLDISVFDNETRKTVMLDVNNVRVEENPEKERVDIVIKMCQDEMAYRHNGPIRELFPYIIENHPDVLLNVADNVLKSAQKTLETLKNAQKTS